MRCLLRQCHECGGKLNVVKTREQVAFDDDGTPEYVFIRARTCAGCNDLSVTVERNIAGIAHGLTFNQTEALLR